MRHFGGLVLAMFGACLAYWVKKRQFERAQREKAFSSFPKQVMANALERSAWVIAIFSIVVGVLLFL